ncbi:hypothetical protein HMPREF0972_01746 [Actinomyces sp. oral taxon 848 str. F0332]|nr:hypothetical protein HMPREF0972_01746 [Actinomyces sp. oral taxon 848 str. F0332]
MKVHQPFHLITERKSRAIPYIGYFDIFVFCGLLQMQVKVCSDHTESIVGRC